MLELGRVLPDVERLARSGENGNVLLAVDRIGHRGRVDAGAEIEVPELLQALGVISRERAVVVPQEHQIAGGRKRAAVVGIFELQANLGLAGGRVEGFEAAVEPLGRPAAAAGKALARLDRPALLDEVLLLDGVDRVAPFDRGNVEQIEFGVVSARLPILAAVMRRAQTAARRTRARTVTARRVFLDAGVGIVVER